MVQCPSWSNKCLRSAPREARSYHICLYWYLRSSLSRRPTNEFNQSIATWISDARRYNRLRSLLSVARDWEHLEHPPPVGWGQGRSDGGYSGIYTPKITLPYKFLCGYLLFFSSLTQDKFDIEPVWALARVSFTYLHATIYTPPNEIPGYAPGWGLCAQSTVNLLGNSPPLPPKYTQSLANYELLIAVKIYQNLQFI